MGLVVQKKHLTIGLLIFDKKVMAYLPSWPTYPTFSDIQLFSLKSTRFIVEKKPENQQTMLPRSSFLILCLNCFVAKLVLILVSFFSFFRFLKCGVGGGQWVPCDRYLSCPTKCLSGQDFGKTLSNLTGLSMMRCAYIALHYNFSGIFQARLICLH